jgi:dihydroflavonol-4-reductase
VSRVFVTGGSGVVGAALVRALAARDDEVVALARSDAAASKLRELGAADVVRGDVLDEASLTSSLRGSELLYHVAGVNAMCVADPAPMIRANVDGAASAVRAAAAAGVRRVVLTSSAATLGEQPGTVGREDTVHRGWYLSNYERSKTLGEHAALQAGRDAGIEVVSVNPSSVQGPGRAGGTGRFLLAFLDGRLKVFVKTWISLVDIDDCAQGHILAAEHGVAGERYLLNSFTLPIDEALALAARVAGVDRKPRMAPRAVAIAGGWLVEQGARIARRKPPVCREMVRTLLHGHRYDGSRAIRDLGVQYTPPEETIERTVEWARGAGLLQNA